jgi:predicted glycosyltransferase involved in capsule biosynthesis
MLHNTSDVAIIIPAARRARALARTLNALRFQSVKGFQVVVVQNDGTRRALRQKYPFELTVGFSQDYGVPLNNAAAARNLGATLVRRATPDQILIFLDADMICVPEMICVHIAAQQSGMRIVGLGRRGLLPAGTCYPAFSRITQDQFSNWAATVASAPDERAKFLETALPNWGCAYSHNLAIRRRLFESIGGFDSSFVGCGGEDVELGFRLNSSGGQFIYLPSAVAYHQHHKRSSQRWRSNLVNVIRLVEKHPTLREHAKTVLVGWRDCVPPHLGKLYSDALIVTASKASAADA